MSKKWLIPAITVLVILSIILGGLSGCAPDTAQPSLGQIFDPSGNPFANRFSDVHDYRTATFIVATSDSEHRFEADYTCNATNAHIEINLALAAAGALPNGGSVELMDGTYNTGAFIDVPSNVSLLGQGTESTIINFSADDHIQIVNDSNVELGHFKITGLGGNAGHITVQPQTADMDNIYIHDIVMTAHNGNFAGIWIYPYVAYTASNVIIQRCKFYDQDGTAVMMQATTPAGQFENIWIDTCYFYRCGYAATRFNDFVIGTSIEIGIFSNIFYTNCLAEECWESGFHQEIGPVKVGIHYANCMGLNNGQDPTPSYGAAFTVTNGETSLVNCTGIGNALGVFLIAETSADSVITITNFIERDSYEHGYKGSDLGANGGRVIMRSCSSTTSVDRAFSFFSCANLDIDINVYYPEGDASDIGAYFGTAAYPCTDSILRVNYVGGNNYPVNVSGTNLTITGYIETSGTYGLYVTAGTRIRVQDLDIVGATDRCISASGATMDDIMIDGGMSMGTNAATGVYSIDSNNLQILNRRFIGEATPININNAAVVNCLIQGCYWGGCTGDALVAGATNELVKDNIDRNYAWFAET